MSFWAGKKVLVTGANGFIGSHLVTALLDQGASVTTTASSSTTKFRWLDHARNDIKAMVGDLSEPGVAAKATQSQDVVMHLASRVGGIEYNLKHQGSVFRDNMRVFLSVLDAARLADVGLFLVTSSACVYPREAPVPTPETEGFIGRPEASNEGYGWAKRMEEYLAQAYSNEFAMKVRIARPGNAYGPRDNFDPSSSHVIASLIRRVEAEENPLIVWGNGQATRAFLYASDFAEGLMAVAEKSPQVEAINLGAEDEVSVNELANMIVRASGRKVEIQFDPSKPSGQPRRRSDTTLAQELLGFRPRVELNTGIANTLSWYREYTKHGKGS